jgi:hypothetical protein
MSDEHFSVHGTLIQSHASLKSLRRIEREESGRDGDPPPEGGRNAPINFRGERRSNATHRSTTDPESRLTRKGEMVGRSCATRCTRCRRTAMGWWWRCTWTRPTAARSARVRCGCLGTCAGAAGSSCTYLLRRVRHVGRRWIAQVTEMTKAAYNLVRMSRLLAT